MSSTACWKKIWLTVTGDAKTITASEALNVLNLVKIELVEGLTQYKPYKADSLDLIPALSAKVKEKGSTLEQFVQKLNLHINLQADIGWKVFCNFLIFEYYGKVEDIQRIAEYELYNTNLFKQLWLFYSSERMYMIKTLKHILENGNNRKHKFQKLYSEFLNDNQASKIRSSLFQQFTDLTNEIRPDNENCCLEFRDWVHRNGREQLEILHLLILTSDYKPYSVSEFVSILDACKKHNFGMLPSHDDIGAYRDLNYIRTSKLTQLAALLIATKTFWENSTDWQVHSEIIESKALIMYHEEELSILSMLYISLQLAVADKQTLDKNSMVYSGFTKMALEKKVFYRLYELASLPNWKDCRTGFLVRQAIFDFVEHISSNFEDDVTILDFDGVVDLVAELVKERQFAVRVVQSNGIYNKIYATTLELFPHSFAPYSKITAELLRHEELVEPLFNTLNNFKSYTEVYNEIPFESVLILQQDYNPKMIKSVMIPKGTKARIKEILGSLYITFQHDYTYFDILEDMSNTVLSESDVLKESMSLVYLGYHCILSILSNATVTKHRTMINSLNLAQSIILRASTQPFVNFNLVATCLDIYKLLLHRDAEKITDGLLINHFLPPAIRDPTIVNNFFENNFLNTSVLFVVIREEITSGRLCVLFAYINFLKQLLDLKGCVPKILTPGLGFLFVHIFPFHLNWNSVSAPEKQRLSEECLNVMLGILQNNYDVLDADVKIIYDFLFQLIVNHIPMIEILNKIFRMTNTYLNICIMNETNWEKKSSIVQIQCLRKVLVVINIVLSLHNKGERTLTGTNFLTTFLDSNIKPSSLKLLTSYMQHPFDAAIPKLSCQSLKKLAVNSDVAMLSLLEMGKYQLQCTFLEKLRDPLEEESLKVAILDLITLCVQKQNGMIVAFFDISHLPGTDQNVGDSVTAFMEEYLANIRKSTDYLYSPIQAAVLDLFHALWMYRKHILVADLTQNERFWSTLMDPLFRDLKLPHKTYSQILNILTYELFHSRGSNPNINQVVEKLFSIKERYTDIWCQHILKVLNEDGNIFLLRSWKDLLIATCKNYPDAISELKRRQLLTETCLQGLDQHFSQPVDIRILLLWLEMYLYLITRWPDASSMDKPKVLKTLTRIFKYLDEVYLDVSEYLKAVVLSISVKTVKGIQDSAVTDPLVVEEHLQAIGRLFEKEYNLIMEGQWKDIKNRDKTSAICSNWLLLIAFGTYLLETQANVCQEWFKLTQFLSKVLKSVGQFVQNPLHFPILKITVHSLMAYARSPLVDHFLCEDLESFFDATRPSDRYIYAGELNYKNAMPWHFEDWWLTYTNVVQLMTLLLQKFGPPMLKKVFSFALVHVDIMRNVMRLPTVTAERTALQLVSECLNFCYVLLKWRREWRLNSTQIYYSYVQSINETINAVTCIVLRPTVLKFFTVERETQLNLVDNIPTSCLVDIMNLLMEIISHSCLCLLRACPSMITLLEPYKIPFTDDVHVENLFHIPKLYDENVTQLKYGTLLCLLHFLCKTFHVQRNVSGSSADLNTSDTLAETGYLAFVCTDFLGGCTIVDKFNSLQTFATSELPRLSTRWLTRLDHDKVSFALETLTTFIAVQTHLTIHARPLGHSQLYYVRRELSSELLYFQEFIRKRAIDQHHYRTIDNLVYRRWYTETIPYLISNEQKEVYVRVDFHEKKNRVVKHRARRSLRIGHFFHAKEQIFYDKYYFNTVIILKSPLEHRRRKAMKIRPRYCGNSKINEKIILEKVVLSYPVEDLTLDQSDYLLMLSNWFFHICQLSH